MRVRVETEIAAPPPRVFAALIDLSGWPRLIPAIRSVEILDPGPVAVGTRFRENRIMHGRPASQVMTIAEIVHDRCLVVTAQTHGVAYRMTHAITPAGETSSSLTLDLAGSPLNWRARLLMPIARLMQRRLQNELAADFAAMRAAIEAGPG
jgi:carbon monoxide dehydrogenase subunit G